LTRVEEIRTAAIGLFTERGYEATTMADIAASLGIRGPSLYKHVESKQDLLAQIMIATMTDLIAVHRAALGTTSDPVLWQMTSSLSSANRPR